MAWPVLRYSKAQVDKAGETLASENLFGDTDTALDILSNWRAAHSFALNTMQMGLRQRARIIDEHALIVQRVKRISSIIQKLRRFPAMKLSRMQDIGGCRAVVETVEQVRDLHKKYRGSHQRHNLANRKDYVVQPKPSGYRGIHLIYRYQGKPDAPHNGRLIEIQLRSKLQHAWATAVETVGVFLDQALKSSVGSEDWLRFFTLAGSAFAWKEAAPLVPGTPSSAKELRKAIKPLWTSLKVARRLDDFGRALAVLDNFPKKRAYYFLLHLRQSHDASARLDITRFPKASLDTATEQYLTVEKGLARERGAQAVLVASESMTALKRAYPNYFLDTQVFVEEVAVFLGQPLPVRRRALQLTFPFIDDVGVAS